MGNLEDWEEQLRRQTADALECPTTWHAYAALGPMAVLGELLNELVQDGVLPKERAARVVKRFDEVVAAWTEMSEKAASQTWAARRAIREKIGV